VAGTGSRVSSSLLRNADLGLIRISQCQHVELKLYVQSESLGDELDTELDVYRRVENSPEHHPGRSAVRSLIESFELETSSGRHRCLVHIPLWESALNIKNRNPARRLPPPVIAFLLDFLHQECNLAHTDIKEVNILLPADSSVLTQF
jgi:serine/threonine-protein kinase SRPK3